MTTNNNKGIEKSFHNPCPYGNNDCPKCSSPLTMEEETSEWRYFRTLNLPFDKAYAEKDGLRFDLEEVNMEETISSAVSQALKEGKKQAVEEILKLQDSVKIDGKISRFVEVSDIKKYLSNNK